ncbi:MAG: DNA translocase FtsK 4TM domain-containing protein [Bacteroidota bacterium]
MAKNTYKSSSDSQSRIQASPKASKKEFGISPEGRLGLGLFSIIISLFLLIAFSSYFFTGQADQSHLDVVNSDLKQNGKEIKNALGIAGALVSELFIFRWFGLAAFLLIPILFFSGVKLSFNKNLVDINKHTWEMLFFMIWFSSFLGYFVLLFDAEKSLSYLCGGIGFAVNVYLQSLIGWPSIVIILLVLALFMIFFYKITSFQMLADKFRTEEEEDDLEKANYKRNPENWEEEFKPEFGNKLTKQIPKPSLIIDEGEDEIATFLQVTSTKKIISDSKLSLEIEQSSDSEDIIEERLVSPVEPDELVKAHGLYDSTLDLPKYQFPTIDLLKDYQTDKAQVTNEELEANSKKIVETLGNYGIGIASIKATIGPTVTLYEIIPDAGVRISKIKSLEDDIALSLAALGIRIIAPIPGKGTIGIEVPNKNREMVSIKSLLMSEKFQKSTMDLPIVLGKTISNDIFITDLAKMPHLLMAGATGQGKSVGLNVIIASLIYKKHPSQLKFVLVDPKKVELTLFNKLERHFLAMLPGEPEPIITNTKKVVNTLNSLCIEMDNRYNLLKEAGCRNLKEYNLKFVNRKLNPEKGHKYMPYIVLIIDELADLMMTAGKEVEQPIARLAQLARAVGLHLIVATQRPSVNVITGIIKANFPARLSFKVTSKIDSRTILDTGGAEQLVGQGDMLLSTGSDIMRLQCAFVDTPEVDEVCDFIGAQQGYDSAYLLPEFEGDESGEEKSDFDPNNRDAYFDEAARLVVNHQQGSTSLIQRRLKLGYNRAGRLIDQLEAAGIVGPFEGSKAREVLIHDIQSLEDFLKGLG